MFSTLQSGVSFDLFWQRSQQSRRPEEGRNPAKNIIWSSHVLPLGVLQSSAVSKESWPIALLPTPSTYLLCSLYFCSSLDAKDRWFNRRLQFGMDWNISSVAVTLCDCRKASKLSEPHTCLQNVRALLWRFVSPAPKNIRKFRGLRKSWGFYLPKINAVCKSGQRKTSWSFPWETGWRGTLRQGLFSLSTITWVPGIKHRPHLNLRCLYPLSYVNTLWMLFYSILKGRICTSYYRKESMCIHY